jgi:hypothetical protein
VSYDLDVVRSVVKKALAATLLTLCVGVHALEVSGHWDRTFHDANDEAGIVAVVLCIAVAISVAGTLLTRVLARPLGRTIVAAPAGSARCAPLRPTVPIRAPGPPLVPLRI